MTVAGVVIGVAVALAVPPLRDAIFDAVQGDTGSVREDLRDNIGGVLLTVWLAMVHAIVWYPAEILDAAVGYVFGFGLGFPLIQACWVIANLAAYGLVRHAARPRVYSLATDLRGKSVKAVTHRSGIIAMR